MMNEIAQTSAIAREDRLDVAAVATVSAAALGAVYTYAVFYGYVYFYFTTLPGGF